jgi:hypothetical protein
MARPEGFEPPANGFEVHYLAADYGLLCCIMLISRLIQEFGTADTFIMLIALSCFTSQHMTIT